MSASTPLQTKFQNISKDYLNDAACFRPLQGSTNPVVDLRALSSTSGSITLVTFVIKSQAVSPVKSFLMSCPDLVPISLDEDPSYQSLKSAQQGRKLLHNVLQRSSHPQVAQMGAGTYRLPLIPLVLGTSEKQTSFFGSAVRLSIKSISSPPVQPPDGPSGKNHDELFHASSSQESGGFSGKITHFPQSSSSKSFLRKFVEEK